MRTRSHPKLSYSIAFHVYRLRMRYPPASAADVQALVVASWTTNKSKWLGSCFGSAFIREENTKLLGSKIKVWGMLDPSSTPATCPIGPLLLLTLCHRQRFKVMPSSGIIPLQQVPSGRPAAYHNTAKGGFWRRCLSLKSLTKQCYLMTSE